MLEYEIKNGGSKTEVSITLEKTHAMDELGYRMLKENRVDGILSFSRSIENDHILYDYDVTGRISFQSLYEGKKIGISEVKELFSNILIILLRAEEYFLDKDSFIIGQEFIYIDTKNRNYGLMYCPQRKVKVKEQLADLTEYIMNRIKYGEQVGVRFTYDLFGLFRDGHSTLNEIFTYVQQGRKQQMPPVLPQNPIVQGYGEDNVQQPSVVNQEIRAAVPKAPSLQCAPDKKEEAPLSSKKLLLCCGAVTVGIAVMGVCYVSGALFISHTNKLDLTRTTAVGLITCAIVGYLCYLIYGNNLEAKEEKPTKTTTKKNKKEECKSEKQEPVAIINPPKLRATILSKEVPMDQRVQVKQPTPIYQERKKKKQYRLVGERQQYCLYKSPYLIGKSVEQVDGVIYSDAVSKVHAEFIEEGEQLYIIDMSSTNGTYVNQRRLTSNQRVEVHIGDQIQIADKQFALIS